MKYSKFRNKKVENEYGKFDSKKEFERYLVLLNKERTGEIYGLKRQVEFELIPPQYKTVHIQLKTKVKQVQKLIERGELYRADFTYTRKDGIFIVEDVKASKIFQDKVYRVKKKLLLYVHGIEIKEVYNPNQDLL